MTAGLCRATSAEAVPEALCGWRGPAQPSSLGLSHQQMPLAGIKAPLSSDAALSINLNSNYLRSTCLGGREGLRCLCSALGARGQTHLYLLRSYQVLCGDLKLSLSVENKILKYLQAGIG